ncbi:hypothetical protein [Paraburkholderia eburnea]|uniref:hypothetical protein n=1 Tax=Paraburkholderia eburnea TaxID=1189126 RepID=UPI001FC9C1FF|nr:hypothetical protein [Paraburkholderia eburnea]
MAGVVMIAVIMGMAVVMRVIVCVLRRVIVAVAVAARLPVVAMIVRVVMRVAASMAILGAMIRVVIPRFDCFTRIPRRCRRACRCRVPLAGARPIALRQCAPRQENLDHGRFLPKVTESLDSL